MGVWSDVLESLQGFSKEAKFSDALSSSAREGGLEREKAGEPVRTPNILTTGIFGFLSGQTDPRRWAVYHNSATDGPSIISREKFLMLGNSLRVERSYGLRLLKIAETAWSLIDANLLSNTALLGEGIELTCTLLKRARSLDAATHPQSESGHGYLFSDQ